MRTKLIRTAAAVGLVAGALLGFVGWILFAVLAFMVALGISVLAAEAVRPLVRARREAAAELGGDWWRFAAGGSRLD